MDEALLLAYLQQHGPFAQWIAGYPLLADQVVSSLITLNSLHGSSMLADLLACRDAALSLHMIARSGGFDDVAAVFCLQYDQLARAMLPFFGSLVLGESSLVRLSLYLVVMFLD